MVQSLWAPIKWSDKWIVFGGLYQSTGHKCTGGKDKCLIQWRSCFQAKVRGQCAGKHLETEDLCLKFPPYCFSLAFSFSSFYFFYRHLSFPSQRVVGMEQKQERRGGSPETEAQGGACHPFKYQVRTGTSKTQIQSSSTVCCWDWKPNLTSAHLLLSFADLVSQTLGGMASRYVCPRATCWLEWLMTLAESHCWTWPGASPFACGKVRCKHVEEQLVVSDTHM